MLTKRKFFLPFLLPSLIACGTASDKDRADSKATGIVSTAGNVAGANIALNSGAAVGKYQSAYNSAVTETPITLSSEENFCEVATAAQREVNSVRLSMAFSTVDAAGNKSAATAGTYTIEQQKGPHTGPLGSALLSVVGSDCRSSKGVNTSATSGSVTFTEVTEQIVSGSFDLMFGADTVKGTFSVPGCAALAKIYAGEQTTETCRQ